LKEDSWDIVLAYKSWENGVRDIIIPLIRFKLFRIESYRTYSELPSTCRRFKSIEVIDHRGFWPRWVCHGREQACGRPLTMSIRILPRRPVGHRPRPLNELRFRFDSFENNHSNKLFEITTFHFDFIYLFIPTLISEVFISSCVMPTYSRPTYSVFQIQIYSQYLSLFAVFRLIYRYNRSYICIFRLIFRKKVLIVDLDLNY